jgi:hypothetical protein
VQRINSAGTALWTANGVALSASPGDQINPQIVSDGSGGAIVVWRTRARARPISTCTRRGINSAGVTQWTTFGPRRVQRSQQPEPGHAHCRRRRRRDLRVAGRTRHRRDHRPSTRNGCSSAGVAQWAANGQVVSNATNLQTNRFCSRTGNQGVIVAWLDSRGASQDVYAQRIAGPGNMLWLETEFRYVRRPGCSISCR